ncbi:MAG: bifunctional 4-hydroxy-2-oxoglutarate aldolase/2-dehydro-3-deoxy-phosphogluconate aldolase [Verrucomicrobiota bacterium]
MNTSPSPQFPGLEVILKQRLICVAVIDKPDHAVALAQALLAGGMNVIEVTFRTSGAAEAISRIRQALPDACVGAGTVLTAHQAAQAADAGAQFLVAPGLDEMVLQASQERQLPYIPGVVTPTEVVRALQLQCRLLKFFPAEASGGVPMLKALAGPFAHTGAQFVPTGGITAATLPSYLALPQVAAVGGSWMAERDLVAQGAWAKITALAAEAMKIAAAASVKAK